MTDYVDESTTDTTPFRSGAGFWIRFLARFIDFGFGIVLGSFISISIGFFVVLLEGLHIIPPLQTKNLNWLEQMANPRLTGELILVFLLYYGGAALYHATCEGFDGATLGKRCCRLRVRSEDGKPCSLKAAIVRNFAFYYLDFALLCGVVGTISMFQSNLKQRYSDRWAKTVVVHVDQIPDASHQEGGRFLLAFGVGSIIWGVLIVWAMVVMAF
jgi:uncharacterized RDD family membrane protein YckC